MLSVSALEVLPDLTSLKRMNFIPCCGYADTQGRKHIKQAKASVSMSTSSEIGQISRVTFYKCFLAPIRHTRV